MWNDAGRSSAIVTLDVAMLSIPRNEPFSPVLQAVKVVQVRRVRRDRCSPKFAIGVQPATRPDTASVLSEPKVPRRLPAAPVRKQKRMKR